MDRLLLAKHVIKWESLRMQSEPATGSNRIGYTAMLSYSVK